MPLDKKKLKEKLDKEKENLTEQLKDIARFNPESSEWDAVPDEMTYNESDQNDMADRFEDFESRSSMVKILEKRLKDVLRALDSLSRGASVKCEVCKKDIELTRLEANPAARTCKKHLQTS